jgi:hydroxyethylthiazole kinase-like uncharacterized protein yjeF
MRILTASEMRAVDSATAEKHGIPLLTLMKNAGDAVVRYVLTEFEHSSHITVVCGKGNNAGDGFVAARKLHAAGKEVRVILLASPAEYKGDAAAMLKELPVKPLVAKSLTDFDGINLLETDLIIDAIFGTGFHAPASGLFAHAIIAINQTGVPVVSIDLPSGADADSESTDPSAPIVQADAIVTFSALKHAHVFQFSHIRTVVRDIGSPAAAFDNASDLNLITPQDFSTVLAPRAEDANKGSFGHVLVLGGSIGKAGAAAMSGMAALRSGAGLVTVATPRSAQTTVAAFAPELMTEPLEETVFGTVSFASLEGINPQVLSLKHDVLALGPGISRNADSAEFVRVLVDRCKKPMVLDADGLNAFEGHAERLSGKERPLVLTPHPGEMSRITGSAVAEIQSNRIQITRDFSKKHNAYVVLKGKHTVVGTPSGRIWINPTGNPGMATGGTGDILTGILAALMAQYPDNLEQAIIAGVWLHGAAGDNARDVMGERSLIATDLLSALPKAFSDAEEILAADSRNKTTNGARA